MKKSAIAASIFSMSLAGFAGNALAQVEDLACNDSDLMCADGDLYYVKVTCFHPDDEEPTLWSGNVELNDDPGYEVSIGFDNTDFADSEGDLNTHKTELSFKGEGQGPGYKPHPQGKHSQYPAVNVEIEFEEGDSPLCE